MRIWYTAVCEAGLREGENQDRIFCGCRNESGLFLVADGMGGHLEGEKASGLIRDLAEKEWNSIAGGEACLPHPYLMDESLSEMLKRANRLIRSKTEEGTVMGSTAVLLRAGKEGESVINCGDSRCYRVTGSLTGPKVTLVSTDDTWENLPQVKRHYAKGTIRNHQNQGKLIRAVGTETSFLSHYVRMEPAEKSLYALMSDGIYRFVSSGTLKKELKKAWLNREYLGQATEKIRKEVYENGAPDNMSLILVFMERPG